MSIIGRIDGIVTYLLDVIDRIAGIANNMLDGSANSPGDSDIPLRMVQLHILVISVVVLAQRIFFSRFGLPWTDEAFHFHVSWLVTNTEAILYEDIFTLYAPGRIFVPGFFMEVFGFGIYSFRMYFSLSLLLLAISMYLIVRQIAGSRIGLYTSLLFSIMWVPHAWEKSDKLVLPFLFVYFAVLSLEGDRIAPRSTVGLGVLAGLSLVISHIFGAFVCLSYGLLVVLLYFRNEYDSKLAGIRHVVRQMLLFSAPVVAAMLVVSLYFYTQSAFDSLVRQLVFEPLDYSIMTTPLYPVIEEFATAGIDPLNLWRSPLTAFLFSYPPLLYIGSMLLVGIRSGIHPSSWTRNGLHLVWLSAFGLMCYRVTLARSSFIDLWVPFIPAFVVTAVAISTVSWQRYIPFYSVKTLSRLVLALVLLTGAVYGQGAHYDTFQEYTDGETYDGGSFENSNLRMTESVLVDGSQSTSYLITTKTIQQLAATNTTAVFLPYYPQYYVYTGLRSPTGQISYIPGEMEHREISELISEFESSRVLVAYWKGRKVLTADGPLSLADYYPRLHSYIISNCSIDTSVGRAILYVC